MNETKDEDVQEILAHDEGKFYNHTLDEKDCPKLWAYKVCRVCGRRWYRGDLVMKIKGYRYNLYCNSKKKHFKNVQQYLQAIKRYHFEDFGKDANPLPDNVIAVMQANWSANKRRRDMIEKTKIVTEFVDKHGVIQITPEHPDYERVSNIVKNIPKQKEIKDKEQLLQKLKQEQQELAQELAQLKGNE